MIGLSWLPLRRSEWVFLLLLSLDNLIAQTTDDFQHHYDKSRELINEDIELALSYGRKAVSIAFDESNVENIGKANWMCGYLMYLKGDLVNSFNYYLGAKKAFERTGNIEYLVQIEENLGSIALDNGSFDLSRDLFHKRLQTAQKLDSKKIAGAYFDLGLSYYASSILDTANYYHLKSLRLYEKDYQLQDSMMIARIYIELGAIQQKLGEQLNSDTHLDSARRKYKIAMEVDRGDVLTSMALNNIGETYMISGHPDTAIIYLERSLSLKELIDSDRMKINTLNNLGVSNFRIGEYGQAINYFERSIDHNIGFGDVLMNENDSRLMLEMSKNFELLESYQYLDTIYRKSPEVALKYDKHRVISRYNNLIASQKVIAVHEDQELIKMSYAEYRHDIKKERYVRSVVYFLTLFLLVVFATFFILRVTKTEKIKRAARKEIERDLQKIQNLTNN